MGDKHGARYVSNKKQRSIAFSQSSRKKSRGILNAQLLFSISKQNIQTDYYDSYGIRRNIIFLQTFFFITMRGKGNNYKKS